MRSDCSPTSPKSSSGAVATALAVALAACGGPELPAPLFFVAPPSQAVATIVDPNAEPVRPDATQTSEATGGEAPPPDHVHGSPVERCDDVVDERVGTPPMASAPPRSALVGHHGALEVHARPTRAGQTTILVHAGEWTPAEADIAASIIYTDAPDVGVCVATEAPPFAVRYLADEQWWSLLELALFETMSTPGPDARDPSARADAAEAVVEAFGGEPRRRLHTLQTLIDSLPRPSEGHPFEPRATLLGVGLMLGEELIRRHPTLTWASADTALARFFGLVDSHDPDIVLRPIDYVFSLYREPVPQGLVRYVELVDTRLAP